MKNLRFLLIGTTVGTLLPLLPVNAAEVDYSNTTTTTLGHALYLAADGDELAAIATLLIADKKGNPESESDASRFYIAETLRSRGVMEEASRYYLTVANDADAKQDLRDAAWLAYARIRQEQRDHAGAMAALQKIKKGLDDRQKGDFAMIKAHALLAAGKTQEAVDAVPGNLKHDSQWALYQRYNLGSLLLGEQNNKFGAAILHTLSEMDVSKKPQLAALKDQANLALGYSLLKISKASKARSYLQQVRINNLLSNMALLGMGWSYAIEQNHEKALVYWLELEERPLKSTYQYEAALAIPYAFGQARAFNQSINYYKAALSRFEGDAAAMSAAKNGLGSTALATLINGNSGEEFAWVNGWQPAASTPETAFLPLFMDNPGFQQALKTYRALLALRNYIDGIKSEITAYETRSNSTATALQQQHQQLADNIEQALQAERGTLQQLATDILTGYQNQLGQYLQQARFGMAQIIEQATQNRGTKQ